MERILESNSSFEKERINNIIFMIEKKARENLFHRVLTQEEIDLLIFKNLNEDELDNAISNIFNKNKVDNTKEYKYPISGPVTVEMKIINYLKNKCTELLEEFSKHLHDQFNSKYIIELITVENITINEFRNLISSDDNIVTIKYNISNLPIYIYASDKLDNKEEIIKEFLKFTVKKIKRIDKSFKSAEIMFSKVYDIVNENYSTILISLNIKLLNEDKGFIILNLPHDFFNMYFNKEIDNIFIS